MTPPHPLALAAQPARRSGEREIDHAAAHQLGAKTVTSALRGAVRDDARTRQEFLASTTGTCHDQ